MLKARLQLIISLLFACLAPSILTWIGQSFQPYAISPNLAYASPSSAHWFGTDELGRDMFARTLLATGLSFNVALQSVAIALMLALVFGTISGYYHERWPDKIISWVISLIYTVPFILIVVAVLAVFTPGIERAYIVIGCLAWAAPARLVRAEVMQIRSAPYILAQRAFGFSDAAILSKTLLPLSFLPALLALLYYIPELIGVEVGLSFFGLGAQPPTPSLGRLIYDGLAQFYSAWWLAFIPAAALLSVTVILYCLLPQQAKKSGQDQAALQI